MPVIFSGPVTGWPSMRIVPLLGIFSPVVSFMKVDLPQPEGPTMAMNSPWLTCSVDVLDRELLLREQFVVVGEPDVRRKSTKAPVASARLTSSPRGRMFSSALRRQEGSRSTPRRH